MVYQPHILDLLAFCREILNVYNKLAGERVWKPEGLTGPARTSNRPQPCFGSSAHGSRQINWVGLLGDGFNVETIVKNWISIPHLEHAEDKIPYRV